MGGWRTEEVLLILAPESALVVRIARILHEVAHSNHIA